MDGLGARQLRVFDNHAAPKMANASVSQATAKVWLVAGREAMAAPSLDGARIRNMVDERSIPTMIVDSLCDGPAVADARHALTWAVEAATLARSLVHPE